MQAVAAVTRPAAGQNDRERQRIVSDGQTDGRTIGREIHGKAGQRKVKEREREREMTEGEWGTAKI